MPESSAQPARPRRALLTEVLEVQRRTPHLIRVVLGGEDLAGFGAGPFTDHYVKLQVPPPGAPYSAPFDPQEVKATHAEAQWPRTRTYTVQAWDPAAQRLTIEFVVHGDTGVAGPWAQSARPGDRLQLAGPGGAYTPDPEADWHLMVGDLSVVPAISASLERVPAGVPVHVVLEVEGPEDEVVLETPGDLHLTYVHGNGGDPELLARTVAGLDWPDGRVHAFVHGEASAVRALRRLLVVERGIPRDWISVSGYWKRARTEEDWRADKPDWNRLVEADEAAASRA